MSYPLRLGHAASAWVVRVQPVDGATGVFRDTPVLARLSRPADGRSLSAATFGVDDTTGRVPARLRLSPDGLTVFWFGERRLDPGVEHHVSVSGLLDQEGREFLPHASRFVACGLAREDLPG